MKDFSFLNDLFKDYSFYEEDHYYTYKGNKVNTSVTQFIETKQIPFDEDTISRRVALRENKSQAEVLAEWQQKADIACDVGTLFHLRSEHLANQENDEVDYSTIKFPLLEGIIKGRLEKLIPMQNNFFKDIKDKLIPLKTEFTVGIDDIIAGNIDLLCYNVKQDEIQIWDYKTNKNINFSNKYEKMLDEFSNLDKCELSEYSIQLNTYKEILERKLNKKIGKCYLVWFNENNKDYKIIQCLDVQKEVKLALDNLIKKYKEEVKDD